MSFTIFRRTGTIRTVDFYEATNQAHEGRREPKASFG